MTNAARKLDDSRRRLHQAALRHVPFDGWTAATLRRAATDAGIAPEAARRAFPDGAHGLLDFHLREADRAMVEGLEELDLFSMKMPERVAAAIRLRLEAAAPHREAARRTLATLALPGHAPLAIKSLARTVDAVWRAVGDRTTDFSWYTRRATLAAVYMSTLLFWLNDESEESAETWAFLERRLAGVMRFHRAKGEFRKAAERARDLGKVGGWLRRFREAV
ncbi:MAG: COQ9 family protein [Alphaproteobacteria bacterium]|nr:COQ9 family protein [Alphaproteobacteria bacterium]